MVRRSHIDTEELRSLLSERSLQVFRMLVDHYIEEGQPVSSRALSRGSGLDLSSATVRNVMADLEDLGLISSPHTSAGRVPTVKGYRLFVDGLLQFPQLDDSAMREIAEEVSEEADLQPLLERTSALLSRLSRFAGVVTLPRGDHVNLKQVEFVSLSEDRVLVVLVMSDHEVQNRIIRTRRRIRPSELQRASNQINRMLRKAALQAVRKRLLQEMRYAEEAIGRLMRATIEFAEQTFRSGEGSDDYVLSGETNLMDVADLGNVEKLKRLFETFQQKRTILMLLDEAVKAEGVQLFIGEESGYSVLDDCSLVTSAYEVGGRVVGVLGVIGPTRMPYGQVIPLVRGAARALSASLNFHH